MKPGRRQHPRRPRAATPDRGARDQQRMDIAAEHQFDEPCQHLRRAEQRADRDHGSCIDAGAAEDREQMRGQRRRYEGVGRKRRDDEHEGRATRRQIDWGRSRLSGGRPGGRGAAARQGECVQRRTDENEQRRIDEIAAAPADRLDQEVRRRPADRRGEAARERQHRDRLPRRGAEDAAERGEGRIVERRREPQPEHDPDRKIGERMIGVSDRDEAGRAQQRAAGHDDMAAAAVDCRADEGRGEPGDKQPEREAAHTEGDRPAVLGRDQRHGQHRRVEDRSPGCDLRDAQHRHRAPGTVNDLADTRHS